MAEEEMSARVAGAKVFAITTGEGTFARIAWAEAFARI
jgi:hypothetical protein